MPVESIWRLKNPSQLSSRLAGEAGLTPLVAQLLLNRGISDGATARSFLRPQLLHLADPMMMKDMDRATAVIVNALEKREKITIFGDYDADGLTATALLLNFLSRLDTPVSSYIPNRLTEGYGLNRQAIEKIATDGTNLIITVDCGISNGAEIAYAKYLGMNVVVTDHHQVPANFPSICPAVDPHRSDCTFPYKHLAGVGLAFFLAVAIRAVLREKGWFRNRPEPDLKEYLDLVALGTVADRAPLTGQNRILVKSGIGSMARSRWAGLHAMMAVADISAAEITADDLAFRLGPRLNAPGRLGDPGMGLEILTVQEPDLAMTIARRADVKNNQRQRLEKAILAQIDLTLKNREGIQRCKTLLFKGKNWHTGVLGIVASKLVDSYYRPAMVLNVQNGMAVGSGRSITGFNLYGALSRLSSLFEKFGGHSHAAGFTLKAENIGTLEREIEVLAENTLGDGDLVHAIDVDGKILLHDITPDRVRTLETLSPFGEENPEPLFYGGSLKVLHARVVGAQHLKLKVRQGQKSFDAIGFGLSHYRSLEGKDINMVFRPGFNRWQGQERIQLRIVDLEPVTERSKLVFENPGCQLDVFGTENKQGFLSPGQC